MPSVDSEGPRHGVKDIGPEPAPEGHIYLSDGTLYNLTGRESNDGGFTTLVRAAKLRVPRPVLDVLTGNHEALPETLRLRLERADEQRPLNPLNKIRRREWAPSVLVNHFDIAALRRGLTLVRAEFAFRRRCFPHHSGEANAYRVNMSRCTEFQRRLDVAAEYLRIHAPDLPRPPTPTYDELAKFHDKLKAKQAARLAEANVFIVNGAVVVHAFLEAGYIAGIVMPPARGRRNVWWAIAMAAEKSEPDKRGSYRIKLTPDQLRQLVPVAKQMAKDGDTEQIERWQWGLTLKRATNQLALLEEEGADA